MSKLERRIKHWIDKRIPPISEANLSHREIFILPTRWGLLYLGLVGLLILTGINYQNSMILAVAFFLFSIFILTIVSAYRNFSAFRLKFHHAEPCFCGDLGGFEFIVTADNKDHWAIEVGWVPDSYAVVDVKKNCSERVILEETCPKRGRFEPGRLLITSTYPMGLFRAWTWQDLNAVIIVYPKPIESRTMMGKAVGDNVSVAKMSVPGQEDFEGLKNYVPGESLNRVAWKKYAQSGEFYTKEFRYPVADPEWIDFNAYDVVDIERRLGMMCSQLMSIYARRQPFGLRMPNQIFSPDCSESHLQNCLTALALYR